MDLEPGAGEIHVTSTPEYVCAIIMVEGVWRPVAVAEMSMIRPMEFFVNRVLVHRESDRGKGFGSRALQAVITEAMERTKYKARIVVTPGGYVVTDSDKRRQVRFYKRNGFVKTKERGVLEWKHDE